MRPAPRPSQTSELRRARFEDFAYDAFISFCRDHREDRTWVTGRLVPFLEGLGLRLCLLHRDMRPGRSRVEQTDLAVAQSRYTVAVFTPEYVGGGYEVFESSLAAHIQIESRMPRFIPLLRRACPLVLHVRMTEVLDVSRDAEVTVALQRLALMLRSAPRPRLG